MATAANATSRIGLTTATRFRGVLQACLFVAAYVVVFRITNILATADLTVSPWNPEAGLSFAAGALFGWPGIVLTFVARLAALALTKPTLNLIMDIPSVSIHVLAFTVPGLLVARQKALASLPNLTFVLALSIGTLLSATLAATFQLLLLSTVTGFDATWFIPSVATLFIGDFIGVLTVAPLFVLPDHPRATLHAIRANPLTSAAGLAAILAVSIAVFGVESTDHFKIFYLVFIPVVIAAIAGGISVAMPAILASDTAMMSIFYVRGVTVSTATELQFFMGTLAVTGLALGALVSDRRNIELLLANRSQQLQESQAALFAATRHTLVSEMAAALAHELNQPLASARNYVRAAARLLERQPPAIEQVGQMVGEAVIQIDAAGELIRETRSFLERGEAPVATVDVGSLIEMVARMTEPELRRSGITLKFTVAPDAARAVGNRTQLQQVILNLIRNGAEAIQSAGARSGLITITVERHEDPEMIAVRVSDNGPGIAADQQKQLFMPFHTTKPKGLGLGLWLCRSIVLAHGGEIWIDPQRTDGATFCFTVKADPGGSS